MLHELHVRSAVQNFVSNLDWTRLATQPAQSEQVCTKQQSGSLKLQAMAEILEISVQLTPVLIINQHPSTRLYRSLPQRRMLE